MFFKDKFEKFVPVILKHFDPPPPPPKKKKLISSEKPGLKWMKEYLIVGLKNFRRL